MHLSGIPRLGFKPLHANELNCLLGYRSDATSSELFDEATRRHHAVLSVLCALSGSSDIHELSAESLSGCINAVRILCSDSAALYEAAYVSVQEAP